MEEIYQEWTAFGVRSTRGSRTWVQLSEYWCQAERGVSPGLRTNRIIKVLESEGRVAQLRVRATAAPVWWSVSDGSESTDQRSIYKEILELFLFPSAENLYGDAGFIPQQDQNIRENLYSRTLEHWWHIPCSMTHCIAAVSHYKVIIYTQAIKKRSLTFEDYDDFDVFLQTSVLLHYFGSHFVDSLE